MADQPANSEKKPKDEETDDIPRWTKRDRSNSTQIDVAQIRPNTASTTCSCACSCNLSQSPTPIKQKPKAKAPPSLPFDLSYFGVKHLGLPGIKRIFNPYANKCLRFGWTMIFIFVLVTCMYQISERVNFYLKSSIGVRVFSKANKTLKLPSVTVCAADLHRRHPAVSSTRLHMAYGNISYTDTYDLLTKTNMSMGKLWNLTRVSVANMTFGLVEGVSLLDGFRHADGRIIVAPIDTTGGRCLMFNAVEDIDHHGYHTFLDLKGLLPENEDPTDRMYQVYVHHEEDVALARLFAAVKGIYVSFSKTVFITVKFKEIIYMNQQKKMCQSGMMVANCLRQCIERRIYKRLKHRCRLPYMKVDEHIRPCTTPDEFYQVYEATDQVLEHYEFSSCSCPHRCRRTAYTINLEIERPSSYYLDLEVYFPENTVERVEEYQAYTLVAMFSDIGGNLGLFLGMSVLNMGEILEVIVGRLFGNRREFID